ncbi:MAG: transcriptional repressor [Gracilibacteraceae bacterium]|jgi:Fur family peroxide stress response transcriptional regulator|nr:transcriptional repressor [Gracilibacteraceae bacterium]
MESKDAIAILKSLKDKGIRFTPQRQAILEYLLDTNSHPTAEEIYRQVKERFPGVSLGTIYNTLNMLKENNFLLELDCGEMSTRFDGNAENHYHVVCRNCGKVVDFHTDLLQLDALATEHTGFAIETHRLVFYGVCGPCREIH